MRAFDAAPEAPSILKQGGPVKPAFKDEATPALRITRPGPTKPVLGGVPVQPAEAEAGAQPARPG